MDGSPSYVPVLRWKKAERDALRDLDPQSRPLVRPYVELSTRSVRNGDADSLYNALEKAVEDIVVAWPDSPLYFDVCNLKSLEFCEADPSPVDVVFDMARWKALQLIPAVTLTGQHQAQLQALSRAANCDGRGAALRIGACVEGLVGRLTEAVATTQLPATVLDLVVDCGFLEEDCTDLDEVQHALGFLPWRETCVVGGAFPRDLSGLEPGEHLLPRHEWRSWLDAFGANPNRPTYGDYTIQHPIYREPPERSHFSASIRYTSDETFVVMRGQDVFRSDGAGFRQWPANAHMLCDRDEFCGPGFSLGDRYIFEKGRDFLDPESGTGNATTWLYAGINHHLTFVSRQLLDLAA